MGRLRGSVSRGVSGLLGLMLVGCAGNGLQLPGMEFGNGNGTGLEFTRVPFVLPSVVAVSDTEIKKLAAENPNIAKALPNSFFMNVTVKNYMEKDSPKVWVRAYREYSSGQNKDQICKQTEWIPINPLQPGKAWTRAAYPIDRFGDCKCLQPECTGTLWLSLHPKQGSTQRVAGNNTALLVRWSPDGKLQKMTVEAF